MDVAAMSLENLGIRVGVTMHHNTASQFTQFVVDSIDGSNVTMTPVGLDGRADPARPIVVGMDTLMDEYKKCDRIEQVDLIDFPPNDVDFAEPVARAWVLEAIRTLAPSNSSCMAEDVTVVKKPSAAVFSKKDYEIGGVTVVPLTNSITVKKQNFEVNLKSAE
mgnify:CR=1 FL=1